MKNKNFYKAAVFVLLTGFIGTFTHCVQNTPVGGTASSGSSRSPSGTAPVKTPEQVINQAQVEVGLKNFEQIHYTFSELTDIPVTTGSVANTYNAVDATLPTENAVKVLNSSHQVAITRLAAEYCNQLSGANFVTSRNRIFGVNVFSQAPGVIDRAAVVVNITNAFWGEGVVEESELAAARNELLDLFDDIVRMDANPAAVNTSGKALRGVCTAALSSAYVTIM